MTREEYARLMGRDATGLQARVFIAQAREVGPLPRYGSPQWLVLPAADVRRRAAVLVAAECWRLESSPLWIRARLEAEQDGARQAAVAEFEDMWRRTLEGINRVDRARAAGSDIGLPLPERRRLALQPRPGDRTTPPSTRPRPPSPAHHSRGPQNGAPRRSERLARTDAAADRGRERTP